MLARLAEEDMQGVDISDDELAKAHGRYLVGGRADVEHERVFRFGTYVQRARMWGLPMNFALGDVRGCMADFSPPSMMDRVSRTAWCASKVLAGDEIRVEHLALPLPESRGWCVVGSPSASGLRVTVVADAREQI